MNRDYQKLIAEYRERFPYNKNIGPKIGASDLQELCRISDGAYQLVDNALLAGIMIGIKYQKNLTRKKVK